jgi:hypothetical protein
MAAEQKKRREMSIRAKAILALYLFLISAFSCAQATTYFANLYAPATSKSQRQLSANQYRFRDHCAYEHIRGNCARQAQQLYIASHQNNNSASQAATHTNLATQSTPSNSTTHPVPNTSKPTSDNTNKPVPATFSTPPAPPAICVPQRQELTFWLNSSSTALLLAAISSKSANLPIGC